MQNINHCTGCAACVAACPKKAIQIKPNDNGFLQVYIDEFLCTECNRCRTICPQINTINQYPHSTIKCYLAESMENAVVKTSTSGGIFFELAKWILDNNGIVFGASFNKEFELSIEAVDKVENLYKLQGSKYVQGSTKNSFQETRKILNEGKYVLYSGTPCQIAGLINYLNRSYDKLLTMDFICHGVPSNEMFKEHIKWLETTKNEKITSYSFRSKKKSLDTKYTSQWTTIRADDRIGKYEVPCALDPYYYAFLHFNSISDACYECKYANTKRVSDITVGDAWSEGEKSKNMLSIVLLNTDKGRMYFSSILNRLRTVEVSLDAVTERKDQLRHPASFENEADWKKLRKASNYTEYANQFITSKMYYLRKILSFFPSFIREPLKQMGKKWLGYEHY